MRNYMDKSVVCPFYSQEEALKIHCEGYNIGTRLHLCFDCKERMKAHKARYCNDIKGYQSCPLNPVIMAQYEEEGDDDE
jgi:hypothetical protein